MHIVCLYCTCLLEINFSSSSSIRSYKIQRESSERAAKYTGIGKIRNFLAIYLGKIEPQLLWNINRKSYVVFRTVPFQKTSTNVTFIDRPLNHFKSIGSYI